MISKQGGSNYNLYREFIIWDDQIVISCNHFFKKMVRYWISKIYGLRQSFVYKFICPPYSITYIDKKKIMEKLNS